MKFNRILLAVILIVGLSNCSLFQKKDCLSTGLLDKGHKAVEIINKCCLSIAEKCAEKYSILAECPEYIECDIARFDLLDALGKQCIEG